MAGIIDSAKEAIGKIAEGFSDFIQMDKSEVIQEFKDSTKEKANAMLEEITNLGENMNKAGFELIEINTSLGLPPTFSLTYHFLHDVTTEEQKSILEENAGKKITTIILKTLFKSTAYAKSLKLGTFKLNEVSIQLGLLPEVGVKFKK